MINELLLFSDNLSLLEEVKSNLEKYVKIPSLIFKNLDTIDNIEIQSNQVLVILSEVGLKNFSFITNKPEENHVLISSKPPIEVLESATNYKLIGGQRHLNKNEDDSLNLGAIKNNINICEPTIRESKLTFIDLNVMRKSELGNAGFAFPSGLFSEDLSQLCRYAGMSENVETLYIHNVNLDLCALAAQLIWYFGEAAALRFPDHPYFTNTVDEYAVEVSSFDTVLSFFKSKNSGRWWVKIPDIEENKWKSCSYEDYQMACKDNISADLLSIIAVAE